MKILEIVFAACFGLAFLSGCGTKDVPILTKEQAAYNDRILRPEMYPMGNIYDGATDMKVTTAPTHPSPAELCEKYGGDWVGKTCLDKSQKKVVYKCEMCTQDTEPNEVNGWQYPPNWSCGKCEPDRIEDGRGKK